MANFLPLLSLVANLLLCFYKISSTADHDTITLSKPLHDGATLASMNGTFELGFFSPGSSANRYVGIWYKNIPDRKVVWVANRENPITYNNSSVLRISNDGNLVLLGKNETLLWSTNSTAKALSPIVQLLDNGNLVLRDNNNNFLWQSFDYPCDTMLPEMKLGWNLKTGLNRRLTAWKNWDDPSPGNLSWGIMLTSDPELVIWNGPVVFHRSGPWNGIGFKGKPLQSGTQPITQKFVNNSDEVYYTYILDSKSAAFVTTLNQSVSHRQRFVWVPKDNQWKIIQNVPRDDCDTYNPCGVYGNCNANDMPMCRCLEGFKPKSPQNWGGMDWRQGCVRSEPWGCGVKDKDGFRTLPNMKLPDTTHSWVNGSMTLEECSGKCMENCSCTAYANSDVNGSGCVIWFGDLLDLRVLEGGQDLYVRMAASRTDSEHRNKKTAILVIAIVLPIVLVLLLIFFNIYRTQRKLQGSTKQIQIMSTKNEDDFELPIFDLATIAKATNNLVDKKLGQGGYGPVYKGTLANGQEIAVKRLSRCSEQGINEFKSEVLLCAKLQHRNLVKVVGCCIEGNEKMLVYEYMFNKSLDSFLFDSARSMLLDWPKRFHIICSIARGLVYLHQDSRLRIIHRDVKASNILLDSNMNPKISDFGLARMCRGDQDEGNTNIVVGTYGYMAPEYVIDGLFSTRSDVYSFGVLLLEIISGKKNKGFTYPRQIHNLIGHAWRLWKEGNSEELIDDCLRDSCILSEVLRCIQIGLLCLQHHPDDRPNIASVVVMLSSENTLPQPNEPGFLIQEISIKGERKQSSSSINEMTVSSLSPR